MNDNNVTVGPHAGELALRVTNSIMIGENAGADIVECDNVVILGDDIRDINPPPEGVVIIIGPDKGLPIYIGKTIFGKRNELYYALGGK